MTGYWHTHLFYSTTSNIICYDTRTAADASENDMQQNIGLNLKNSIREITILLYKL
jgi:hypothetical protein